MENKIFKICPQDDWEKAKSEQVFKGSGIDLIDGFIHFSTQNQVIETARIHFSKKESLVLLEIESKNLNLKWEKSRNGDLFPHLYENLQLRTIIEVYKLELDNDKKHIFPKHLTHKRSL